jgi:hypothetical protein
MNLRRTMWMAICVVGIFVASRAYAVGEVYTGRVTVIGAETMPSYVGFVLDVGAGACPAGHWLAYRSTQGVDGTKAAYAFLISLPRPWQCEPSVVYPALPSSRASGRGWTGCDASWGRSRG